MPNQILALALIFLAALPGFSFKTGLESRLAEALIGKPEINLVSVAASNVLVPLKIDPMAGASVGAKAAYFTDLTSGEVLLAKNENEKLSMASTTKLMTAIIAIENLDMEKVLIVKSLNTLPLDSVMGLSVGDSLKTRELLHGLLIESGGDAAETLAIGTGGTEKHFVALMNEKAAQFGMSDTQFTNVVGHDSTGHYSTAKDLSKLARIALSNKTIKEIVAKRTYLASAESGKKYHLTSTNLLLADPNFKGLKTGTTYSAGECLISYYTDGKREILGVVLASPDRFGETYDLIEWTKRVFSW